MGWCSGTELFDTMIEILRSEFAQEQAHDMEVKAPITDERVKRLIANTEKVIKAFWSHDWDCEGDSAYCTVPFVRQAFLNLGVDLFPPDDD